MSLQRLGDSKGGIAVGVVGGLIVLGLAATFLGLAGAAAVIFGLVYGARRGMYALKGEPYRPLLGPGKGPEYSHQDVDTGSDAASVKAVLKRYLQTNGVSKYARAGINALESADRKAANFRAVLDSKFQNGSLTWNKFASAASMTQEAVLRNCAELANAIQVFDHANYKSLEQTLRRSTFRRDATLSSTQEEQFRLLQAKLGEMESICNANDKVLLELDKLQVELDKLDDADSSAESERLINEIQTLIDETKYYKQGLEDLDKRTEN